MKISSRITTLKEKAIFTDWTLKTWNGLLLLDSNSLHRLTWIKTETETWQTCQVISSKIVFWCCSSCLNCWCGQLQQSLGLLLRAQGCGKCWPCRSKALRQKLISAVCNSCSRSWILLLPTIRQKLDTAVYNGGGKCWILPFLTVAAEAGFCRWLRFVVARNRTALVTMMTFYLEAVQDVCWCLHCFCDRLVL